MSTSVQWVPTTAPPAMVSAQTPWAVSAVLARLELRETPMYHARVSWSSTFLAIIEDYNQSRSPLVIYAIHCCYQLLPRALCLGIILTRTCRKLTVPLCTCVRYLRLDKQCSERMELMFAMYLILDHTYSSNIKDIYVSYNTSCLSGWCWIFFIWQGSALLSRYLHIQNRGLPWFSVLLCSNLVHHASSTHEWNGQLWFIQLWWKCDVHMPRRIQAHGCFQRPLPAQRLARWPHSNLHEYVLLYLCAQICIL